MTDAEKAAINEQLRYMPDGDIHDIAKILFKYGFAIVRHAMPKQDYYER